MCLHTSIHTLSQIVPGFGRSEEFYTVAVTMYSVGELFGALISPLVYKFLPNRFSFLIGSLCVPIAFIIYCLAPSAWFILLARLIVGSNAGLIFPLVSIYMSETSILENHRVKMIAKQEHGDLVAEKSSRASVESAENPLRDKLFAVITVSGSGTNIILLGKEVQVPLIHIYPRHLIRAGSRDNCTHLVPLKLVVAN